MLAAQNGHANVVKVFLEFGVDPNPQSGFNSETSAWYGNPLTAAAENGHEDVVRLLADHGVDLEFADIYRHPIISADTKIEQPICLATLNKHVPVIKLLLERGCNPHECGSLGNSAVSYAAAVDLDILKLFIEARPDLKLADYDPNPLENAIAVGNIAVAEFLLKEEPRLLPSGLGAFQLFEMAADHSPELAKLILDRIDLEKAIRKGDRGECRHLVIGAASAGLEDLMKRLKEGGCLSQRDPDHELNRPLCSAIQKGQVGMVTLLLDYGANPNSRRTHPFEIIMECGPPYGEELSEIAKELLRRGSVLSDDLDASFSYEALRSFQTLEVFQFLLEERLSRTFNKMETDHILQNSVDRGEDAFELVMAHFKVELQPGREGHQDAMAQAAMGANAPILKRFLDAGFDVNSRVDDLWRLNLLALVAAYQDVKEDRRAANLLLEHGADIEGVDEPGQASSLFMLVSMSDGYDELGISKGVKFLLDLGADPFFTKDGESPLDVAVRLNELPIVKVLVEFFEKQGDAAFQKIKETVVRAASKTHSEEISRLLWHYYWPRVYPCS
jgi:ankyrin repeat protein